MSADNGIYILKSPSKNSDIFEYRVIEAQAIDNINYEPDRADGFNTKELLTYFGEAQIFFNQKLANDKAFELESEIKSSIYGGRVLEYGINNIDLLLPFPEQTLKNNKFYKNQIKNLYDEHDNLIVSMSDIVNRLEEISKEIKAIKDESGLSLAELLSEE